MAGSSNPYSQARDQTRKRARDESVSPRPPKRRSEGPKDDRHPQRPRSRSPSSHPDHPTSKPPSSSSFPAGLTAARPRKRPGASARLTDAQKEALAAQQRQRELERERREAEAARQHGRQGIHEAVREHYNLVPQRGRDWRRTESKIKGLREFNNWVKSTLIQRFSGRQEGTSAGPDGGVGREGLLVLDIGCGKGGDLFKWQKAPQRVGLYVGVDPAEVSIQQARGRYDDARRKSRGRIFRAEFIAKDAFGEWLGDIPVVREVGIDPGVGPGGGGNARWGGGGFDVVTMMFCMHYAMESEEKARGMLKNVAGSLKKGGRMMGVLPSSDVIRDSIEDFYKDWQKKRQFHQKTGETQAKADANINIAEDKAAIEKKKHDDQPAAGKGEVVGQEKTIADDERSKDETTTNGLLGGDDGAATTSATAAEEQRAEREAASPDKGAKGELDGADAAGSPAFVPDSPAFVPDSPPFVPDSPEADAPEGGAGTDNVPANGAQGVNGEAVPADTAADAESVSENPEPTWGNSLYNVRFPPNTPKDGVFRPPFGWKYNYWLEEAVEAPEYVVPFEAFRAMAEDYNLELTYRKPFLEIWEEEKDDPELGPLSVRMGVTDRPGGRMKMSEEEREAAAFYMAFCFVKI